MILKVPSNIVFYDSLNSGQTPLSFIRDFKRVSFTGLDSLVQGFWFGFFQQTVIERIFVLVVLNIYSAFFCSYCAAECSKI